MLPLLAQVEPVTGSVATGMAQWAWLIPIFTIAAFVVVGVSGKRLAPKVAGGVAVAGVGISMLLSLAIVLQVLRTPDSALPLVMERHWLEVGTLHFDVGFYIDHLTAIMLFVVGVLSFLIVVYSTAYMHGESGIRRYFAEIALFITGMLGLVLANDFLLLFIFWEIMGLCSYLLIGYWYEKPEAAAAAKKAFLVTRVGDVFFFAGLVIMATTFGTTNMRELFGWAAQYAAHAGPFLGQEGALTAICLLFFGGAMGKSGQFPLHVWLPDAMEGPTTVSALIHAATMVKAGVYLIARAYPLFAIPAVAATALTFVAGIGAFTAFFAATMALAAYDIKRILAYSTLSQLAYMFFGLGVGAVAATGSAGYTAGVFHLTSHAFTKALLFLGAGSVIHAVHTNDIRHMGGLRKYMPITSLAMLVGALSMAGFPGLSIFWSKDAVLSAAWLASGENKLFLVFFVLGLLTALMTAFYMFRLWFMAFWGEHRGAPHSVAHGEPEEHGAHHARPHESPPAMTGVLIVLSVFAAAWGIAMLAGGIGGFVFFGEPEHETIVQAIANPVSLMSIVVGLVGIGLAYAMYAARTIDPARVAGSGVGAGVHNLLTRRYYIDDAYNWVAGVAYVKLANAIDWFDRNVLDGVVNGIAWAQLRTSDSGRRMQTGNVQDYAAILLAGVLVVVMLAFYVLNPNSLLHQAISRAAPQALAGGS
ncbi:MAG: NADH-quinone oxidoreductase subunit L [Halobacteriales archaeon]|nr:NADH-quinone oxidoreductase subunit L [Halobacteriales archaeon]